MAPGKRIRKSDIQENNFCISLKEGVEKLLAVAEALPSLATPFRLRVKMGNFSAVQHRCCLLTFPGTEQELIANESVPYFFLWQQRG